MKYKGIILFLTIVLLSINFIFAQEPATYDESKQREISMKQECDAICGTISCAPGFIMGNCEFIRQDKYSSDGTYEYSWPISYKCRIPREQLCCKGERKSDGNGLWQYCVKDNEWKEAKEDNDGCVNNYECISNLCSGGRCFAAEQEIKETKGLLEKIRSWLCKRFGVFC